MANPASKACGQLSDIPAEIRLQIWNLAIPRARILRIQVDPSNETINFNVMGRFSTVPTILHICHESRQVGLEIFHLANPWIRDNYSFWNHGNVRQFYWNPAIDTVYLPWGSSMYHRCDDEYSDFEEIEPDMDLHNLLADRIATFLPMVRHLALPAIRRVTDRVSELCEHEGLHKITGLQTLFLVGEAFRDWVGDPFVYSVAFHESLDVPVVLCGGFRPQVIEERFKSRLEDFQSAKAPDWKLPDVEFVVLGQRKYKHNGFCIAPPSESETSLQGSSSGN